MFTQAIINEGIDKTRVRGPAVMKKLFWLLDVNSEVRE